MIENSCFKLPNENLKEYLLTIETEYKPQAYEQDNYHLLKNIIKEKIRKTQL